MECYRRTLLKLAVLCNVIGAVLLFFFVLSLRGPQEPQPRSHSIWNWIAKRLAPEVPAAALPPGGGGTYVYGPFLLPVLHSPAGSPASQQPEREVPRPVSGSSLLPGLPLPQMLSLVPRPISPLPVESSSISSATAPAPEAPASVQVTLPAHLFSDSQQASEVALRLGDQLSRQGYLATVVVTDQEDTLSISTPAGNVAALASPEEAVEPPPAPSAGELAPRVLASMQRDRVPTVPAEVPGLPIREASTATGYEMASTAAVNVPIALDRDLKKQSFSGGAAPALLTLPETSSALTGGGLEGRGPARLAEALRPEVSRAVQIVLPACHFSNPDRAAEVATSVGQQLSRQGYVTTVAVTDQTSIAAAGRPREARPIRPENVVVPVPALSETVRQPVRIAQAGPEGGLPSAWERRGESAVRRQAPSALAALPYPSRGERSEEAEGIRSGGWEPSRRSDVSLPPVLERPKIGPQRKNPGPQSEKAPQVEEALRIASTRRPVHLPTFPERSHREVGRIAPQVAPRKVSSASFPASADRSQEAEVQVVQVARMLNGSDPSSPRPRLLKEAPPAALQEGSSALSASFLAPAQQAVRAAALRIVRTWRRTRASRPSPGKDVLVEAGRPLSSGSVAAASVAPQTPSMASEKLSEGKSEREKRSVWIAAAPMPLSGADLGIEKRRGQSSAAPVPPLLAKAFPLPRRMASSSVGPVGGASGTRGLSLLETERAGRVALPWQVPLPALSLTFPPPTSAKVAKAPVHWTPSTYAPAAPPVEETAIAVVPSEPIAQPVRIAWASRIPGMPHPPSGLPWEVPRDAPPPFWGSLLNAGEPVTSTGQQAVRVAAARLVEAWRRARAMGPTVVQPLPTVSPGRDKAGSDALLAVPPSACPLYASPVSERERKGSKRVPLSGKDSKNLDSASVHRSAYQVVSAFEVQLASFQSREEAWPLLPLQRRGLSLRLRDLSVLGQPKVVVWAGPYTDATVAEALKNSLQEEGYPAAVCSSLSFLPADQATGERFAVQVVCLHEGSRAQQVAQVLAADGLPHFLVQDPTSALWRVLVGPLATSEAARQVAQYLEWAGYPTWVVSLDGA